LSIVGGALVFGTIINEFIPRGWILNDIPDMQHGVGHHQYNLLKIGSAIVLIILIFNGYFQKYLDRKTTIKQSKNYTNMELIQVYTVEGMTCNHCKTAVENGVRELSGSGEIFADPSNNELRISSGNIPIQEIKKKVESLGYIFKGRK
jgi:copper chaperone CopZ